MNNIFKSALAASLMLFAGSLPIVTNAQITANVSLSGNLNGNLGANNYSGFPINSLYHVQLVNQGIQIAQGVLQVNLVLPPCIEFMTTYPAIPAGWTYTRVDAQTATLVNASDDIEILPILTAIVTFDVPIKTVASTNGTATFGWGAAPSLFGAFNNWIVPSGPGNTSSGFTTINNTPLNIQFKEFTAEAQANCMVNITWKTSVEMNTEKFQVERSLDGVAFKSIGELKATAATEQNNEYSFVDRQPGNNHNFYRIRQITMDGKSSSVSNVESVKMDCVTDAISVYPNPTEGIVYIKGLTDKGTVRVFNAVGQLVLEKELQNSIEGVNMSSLADGFYQINIMKGDESIFNTKLIKK
jgi:hypothetical protein